jgi:hypothetical protein
MFVPVRPRLNVRHLCPVWPRRRRAFSMLLIGRRLQADGVSERANRGKGKRLRRCPLKASLRASCLFNHCQSLLFILTEWGCAHSLPKCKDGSRDMTRTDTKVLTAHVPLALVRWRRASNAPAAGSSRLLRCRLRGGSARVASVLVGAGFERFACKAKFPYRRGDSDSGK